MTLISLKFSPDMEELILLGRKCCTTRDEKKAEIGDVFIVRDRIYRIVQIDVCNLFYASAMANAEGFESDTEYEETIFKIYPDLVHESRVYLYFFAYVTDVCEQLSPDWLIHRIKNAMFGYQQAGDGKDYRDGYQAALVWVLSLLREGP